MARVSIRASGAAVDQQDQDAARAARRGGAAARRGTQLRCAVEPVPKTSPVGPRLAEAPGGLEHALVLKGASGEPAGRRLSQLCSQHRVERCVGHAESKESEGGPLDGGEPLAWLGLGLGMGLG